MLEVIYKISPVFLQNIYITIFGVYWYLRRFSGVFGLEYKRAVARDKFTYEEWEEYQLTQLKIILKHALAHVPYYKQKLSDAGIGLEEIDKFSLNDLKRLPYLEKKDFRAFGRSSLLSTKLQPCGLYLASSGSTGTPTYTRYSLRMHQKYYAICEARINNWAGLNYKIPRGTFGGRRVLPEGTEKAPYYRYNSIEKQTYFSSYHISRDNCIDYLEGIKKNKVEYLTGYASANYVLAKFIKAANLQAPTLKAVLTSSEKLTPEMRAVFKDVYNCKTYDSYNGVECCNLISECEYGRLHIVPDVGIVEILNLEGKDCSPGEIGEVISTGLINQDQPLIRYRIGDYIRISKNQNCQCGRNMIVVDEIIGRVEDFVKGPDGRLMSRFHSVFIGIDSILEGQLIQHEIDKIELLLSVERRLDINQTNTLVQRVRSQLGEVSVEINYVEYIPRSSNGKFKSVISYVDKDL